MKTLETKVIAAAAGSGAGAALASFVLWLLGVTAFHASPAADAAAKAVASVPEPVGGIVGIGLTVALTALAGYLAPHTARPDLATAAAPVAAQQAVLTSSVAGSAIAWPPVAGYVSSAGPVTVLPVVPAGPAPGAAAAVTTAPTVVGEPGPEIVNIPAGTTVTPSAPPVA
jgi:hypothetical protein